MKRFFASLVLTGLALLGSANANAFQHVRGFNLTEIGDWKYDASQNAKTPAQTAVDKLYDLGVRHIILNPRATMSDPRGTEVSPVTPASDRAPERQRYLRLIQYIKSKGMTVGIRPIFFVVNAQGQPYDEVLPDGSKKRWWHGNIEPADPNKWFDSFLTYLDNYLFIARMGNVDEFTIGAELYSMTVGIEDQWRAFPHGFPGRFLQILKYARQKLPAHTRIMYDINFTDDSSNASGITKSGGELERWRYRLVDLANPPSAAERAIWEGLVEFWKSIDAIGIDMYRSLASREAPVPADYESLVAHLQQTTDRYAEQLDMTLAEIQTVTGVTKPVIFKEVGFKSMQNGFIDPYEYDGSGNPRPLNITHQSAGYEAMFRSFWDAQWPWFAGFNFWDVSIDPARHGATDRGFSPLGKSATENVIRSRFN